jgi:hypothetical protein
MNQFEVQVGDQIFTVEAADEATAHAHAQSEWMRMFGGGQTQGPQGAPASAVGDNGVVSAGIAGAQGFNTGLANVAGAPVDVINWLMSKAGVRTSDQPFGGSEFIKRQLLDRTTQGVGAAVNAVAPGTTVTDKTRSTYSNLDEVPEDYRWAARGGEAAGGSVVPYLGIAGAARAAGTAALMPATMPQGILEGIRGFAARNPTTFALGEAASAGGAAQGAGIAEGLFPGNTTAGMIGETVGGVFNPLGTIVRGAGAPIRAAKDAVGVYMPGEAGKTAREAAAGRFLVDDVIGAGIKDPTEKANEAKRVLDSLNAPDVEGVPFRVAEQSDNTRIQGLEDEFARRSPEFARRRTDQWNETRAALGQRVEAAAEPGDVGLLRSQAETELSGFEQTYQTRLQQIDEFVTEAEGRAAAAAGKFERTDPEAGMAASREARAIITKAEDTARSAERALWGDVPQDLPVPVQSTATTIAEIRADDLLPKEGFNKTIDAQMARIEELAKTGKAATSGELLTFRSRLLRLARDTAPDPNGLNAARIYRKMANGILDDLAGVPGADEARAFSRALNDRFSRTFAGEVMGYKSSGADLVRPEETLGRAYGTGGISGRARMDELADAARPIQGRGEDLSPQMTKTQEEFLRYKLAGIVRPDGSVNPTTAARFMQQNPEILARFPALRDELAQVVSSTSDAARAVSGAKPQRAQAKIEYDAEMRSSPAARIAKEGERPQAAVHRALSGSNPQADLSDYIALARRAGDGGDAAIRGAAIDWALAQATGKTRGILHGEDDLIRRSAGLDFKELKSILERPLAPNQPSLLQTLRKEGVITTTQEAQLKLLLERGLQFDTRIRSGSDMRTTEPDSYAFKKLARIAGVKLQSLNPLSSGGAGESLQLANMAASTAERALAKIPAGKVSEVVKAALEDKELMKRLLEAGGTPKARAERARFIYGALIQAGVIEDSDERQ